MCHINERSYCQKANFLTSGSFPGIALKDKRIKNCLWVSCASHFVPQIIAIGSETFRMNKKVETLNDKNWGSGFHEIKRKAYMIPFSPRDQIITLDWRTTAAWYGGIVLQKNSHFMKVFVDSMLLRACFSVKKCAFVGFFNNKNSASWEKFKYL